MTGTWLVDTYFSVLSHCQIFYFCVREEFEKLNHALHTHRYVYISLDFLNQSEGLARDFSIAQ